MSIDTNSLNSRKSRYVSGGTAEVNASGTAIEWFEPATFAAASDDTYYVIERRFAGRIDLVAALFLGDPRYWWVIAQYNSILDPYSEFVEGATVAIPSQTRLQAILGGKTGGVTSTREVPTTVLPIV